MIVELNEGVLAFYNRPGIVGKRFVAFKISPEDETYEGVVDGFERKLRPQIEEHGLVYVRGGASGKYAVDHAHDFYMAGNCCMEVEDPEFGKDYMLMRPHSYMPNPAQVKELLGKKFRAVTYREQSTDSVFALDGPLAGTWVMLNATAPYNEEVAATIKPLVVRLTERAQGAGFCGQFNGIHVEALQDGNRFVCMEGRRAGQHFTGAEVVEENEHLHRRVVHPRQLTVGTNFDMLLRSTRGEARQYIQHFLQPVGAQDIEYPWLALDAPTYIEIDPADYNKVSALPFTKVQSVLDKGEDPWTSTSRYTTTYGKLVSNMFVKGLLSTSNVEQFNNAMLASAKQLFAPESERPEMLVVRGEDIKRYYHENMYSRTGSGSLWNSCMRYAKCQPYFGIYTENPEQVGLLISRDRADGKITGRALLWSIPDKDGNIKHYLDRRYGTSEVEEGRLLKAGEDLGYINIWQGRDRNNSDLSIQLPNCNHAHYPYMDSMCYLNPKTKILSNKNKRGFVSLRSTGGDREIMQDEARCAESNRIALRTDMVELVGGEYALPQYTVTLNDGFLTIKKYATADTFQGGFIHAREAVGVETKEGGKVTYRYNNAVCTDITGTIWPKELCVFSPLDKGYILKDRAVEVAPGKFASPEKADLYRSRLVGKVNKAKLVAPVAVPVPAEFAGIVA